MTTKNERDSDSDPAKASTLCKGILNDKIYLQNKSGKFFGFELTFCVADSVKKSLLEIALHTWKDKKENMLFNAFNEMKGVLNKYLKSLI